MSTALSPDVVEMIDRSPKGTLWNLQILRFLAAAMVLFSHLNHEVTQRPSMATGFHPLTPIWWAGGVDIFFVISGFIMHYISDDAFGRSGAALNFVRRRLVRLVPPYWLFTFLALLVMLFLPGQMARHTVTARQVLGSFFFVPAAGPDGKALPILILGWTLNFEMLFYAVFAAGLRFRKKMGLTLIAAVLVLIASTSMLQPLRLPLGFWCNNIVLEFLFGVGLSILHRQGMRLPFLAGVVTVAIGVGSLLAVQAAGWPGVAWNWRFLWAGLPSALICAGVVLVPEGERLGQIRRVFVFLGDASFALYLSHPFVLSGVAMVTGRMGMTSSTAYIAVAAIACLVGASSFFVLVERPSYRWIGRMIDREHLKVSE